ncbi:MAG: rhodanese-like domain-containing protein [Ilumatobacteraceae bacterium]|nr:rhodanese-like domain-containing protein [Actinomycetota bacterium]
MISEVSVAELRDALAAGARLIDVREADEYAEAHIVGSELMPLSKLAETVGSVGVGPVFVICKSGGRSAMACEFMASVGIEVTNVSGGMMSWLQAGFEAEFAQ